MELSGFSNGFIKGNHMFFSIYFSYFAKLGRHQAQPIVQQQ
jgi:hypothetical protein